MRDSKRLVVTGQLTALQPITVGCGEYEGNLKNRALVAVNHSGTPVIPGTSLAGVMRSRLVQLVGAEAAAVLFGPDVDASELRASPLVVDEAVASELGDVEATNLPLVARTAIDRDRGSAAAGLLFETEYVPVDARFTMRMHLIDPTTATTRLLSILLQSMESEPIAVGGSTRSGRGDLELTCLAVRDLDLTDAAKLRRYLLAGIEERDELGSKIDLKVEDHVSLLDAEPRLRITCALRPVQPLLGGRVDRAGTDGDRKTNVTRHQQLTASSIRGALRSRAERIQRTMQPEVETWDAAIDRTRTGSDPAPGDLVSRLFGSTASAGRIRFHDGVHKAATQEFTSTAVDRWTGGVVQKQLFVNAAAVGGEVSAVVEAAATDPACLGLLFLTLLDVADGDLPLGSSTRRGMGEMELLAIDFESRGSVAGLSDPSEGSIREWVGQGGWTKDDEPVTRQSIVRSLPSSLKSLVTDSVNALTIRWEVAK